MSETPYSHDVATRLAELFTLMVGHIETALPDKVAMIAIRDPNNPRGSLLFNGSPDELRALADEIETSGQRKHVTIGGEIFATDEAN